MEAPKLPMVAATNIGSAIDLARPGAITGSITAT
jgi:hypothetical protein